MTKYEIKKATREIRGYKNRNKIGEGCTLEGNDIFDEIVKSFDSKDEALNALKAYKSEIDIAGDLYMVTEYFVQENEYDEDGEWIDGGDIWEFSPLPEEVEA